MTRPNQMTTAVVDKLDYCLGLSSEAAAVLKSPLEPHHQLRFIRAGRHVADYAVCIAGFSTSTRKARRCDWLRIQNLITGGRYDEAFDQLYALGEEIRCCALHDSDFDFPTWMLIPLVAVALPAAILGVLATIVAAFFGKIRLGLWTNHGAPPLIAEMLLFLTLPKGERQHALGDLQEEFGTFVLPRFGSAYAVGWCWYQVFASILDRSIGAFFRWFFHNFRTFAAELIAALMKQP